MLSPAHDSQRRIEVRELVTHPGWERVKDMLKEKQQQIANDLVTQTRNGTIDEIRFASGKLEAMTDTLRALDEIESNAFR